MALVARASATVRNKNILIVLMCAGFLGWFGFDGFVGYPQGNDRLVNVMRSKLKDGVISPDYAPQLDAWTKWNNESSASRAKMTDVVNSNKNKVQLEGWKAPLDVTIQVYIVYGLAAATAAAIWWFIHCQRRRAIADETTVSPAPGVVVPWEKITRVDNTRWKSMGIVEITFTAMDGSTQKAKFDDYEMEREPLIKILELMEEKAVHAEFIPKEEGDPAPGTPEQATP